MAESQKRSAEKRPAPNSRPEPKSRKRRADADDAAALPTVPDDERGIGWGDPWATDRRDDDWYEQERPPHHG